MPESNARRAKARSGRTTRMVAHAVQMAQKGRMVYVAMLGGGQILHWERWRARNHPTLTNLRFERWGGLDIDWTTITLRGAHSNCLLFVDHAVIETEFSAILLHIEQYDNDSEPKYARDRDYKLTINGEPMI